MTVDAVRVDGTIKRVGNSLAFFIPADVARKAGLVEGQHVAASIDVAPAPPLGLLAHLPYEPFDRRKEERKRDRI